jgi:hypothetical protein
VVSCATRAYVCCDLAQSQPLADSARLDENKMAMSNIEKAFSFGVKITRIYDESFFQRALKRTWRPHLCLPRPRSLIRRNLFVRCVEISTWSLGCSHTVVTHCARRATLNWTAWQNRSCQNSPACSMSSARCAGESLAFRHPRDQSTSRWRDSSGRSSPITRNARSARRCRRPKMGSTPTKITVPGLTKSECAAPF